MDMIKKIAIVHTDFRLYWHSRLQALSSYLKEKQVELHIVEISGKGSPYNFDKMQKNSQMLWRQLFEEDEMESIDPKLARKAVVRALDDIRPDIVLSGAIAFPSGAASILWAWQNKRPLVVFDNARLEDVQRPWHVNFIKKKLYSMVDAMVIPAPSHIETFTYFGLSEKQLFFGINCIDNAFFDQCNNDASIEKDHILVDKRYILAIGRQVKKKNWTELLKAFMDIAEMQEMTDWHLVFIGNGPDHQKLIDIAGTQRDRRIHFRDYKTQMELCTYYGRAEALILPSLYGETWGLVVNEAMASGLPVIVSKKCGCSKTLVLEGKNGYLLDPDSRADMKNVLLRFAALPEAKRIEMGRASKDIIAEWGLERFCNGVWDACEFVHNKGKKNGSPAGKLLSLFWNGRYRPT
jgi:glycosyltransferase involved in cell wall biosynthesis